MSYQLEPELERVARMLANAGRLPDAPATLRERALAIPDGGPVAAADLAAVAPRRWRRPRVFALAGVAAAVAAIAIVPAVVLTTRGDDVGRSIELAARPFAPKGGGSAHVVAHGDGSATIELSVWKMPRPGPGHVYKTWLGNRGDRRALGVFRIGPDGKATVTYELPRGQLSDYRWLWVTSEPAGSSEAPTRKTTALWGPLT
jgi:hypothetical protein